MKKSLVLVATLLAIATPAAAQGADNARMIEHLRAADTNNDGVVSRAEFAVFRGTQFSRLDRNNDGFITSNDTPRFAARRVPAGFSLEEMAAQFDANRDGRVSEYEFTHGPTPMFDRVDANHDGLATQAEFEAAAARARAQRS